MKRPAVAAISALALLVVGFVPVSAQPTGDAAHVPSFAKLPDSAIAQFKANPQGLLTTYASAGLPLSTEVRILVLTDPSLVDALITVAKGGANDAQKAAIGGGLAEAARIIVATDPTLAAQIQLAVAQSGLKPLITAYIAASYATVTAATGEGGGGGGGGGGPTGGVGSSTGSNTGASPGGSSGAVNTASAFGSIVGTTGGGFSAQVNPSVSPVSP
jgi:hypothetical protein